MTEGNERETERRRVEKQKWRAWGTIWSSEMTNVFKNVAREDKGLKKQRESAKKRWRPRHCCQTPPVTISDEASIGSGHF